jgi:hypothetical protein
LTTKAASRSSAAASPASVRTEPQPLVGRLDERVDEREHPRGHEHGAARVEARARAPRALARDQPDGARQHDQADRQVHEHHPAPAGSLRQDAAEEHAGGGCQPGHPAPDAERLVAVRPVRERGGEQRQRGGEHQRRAGALEQAGAHQHLRAPREPAGQRGEHEERRAGEQDAAAAEQVARAPAEQHEAAAEM